MTQWFGTIMREVWPRHPAPPPPPVAPAPVTSPAKPATRHRPDTWDDLIGAAAAKEALLEAVEATTRTGDLVPHTLIDGPPGTGKTTMAELLAKSIGGGIVKTTGSTLETTEDMLKIMDELYEAGMSFGERPVVWFVDECHVIGLAKGRQAIDVESLYTLMEDWVFYHNMQGKKYVYKDVIRTPRSGSYPARPFTLVGATTDPGLLPMAFLRRFLLQVHIEPYTDAEIAEIMVRTAGRQGWPLTPEGATTLAAYARRTPGTGYQLLVQARSRAAATGAPIDQGVAEYVIRRLRLHPLGLTERDVQALELLAQRPKGIGAGELARALGVAPTTFSALMEPHLRFLGFVETLQRRTITKEGVEYLRSIGRVKEAA